jgi:hypothetical protein
MLKIPKKTGNKKGAWIKNGLFHRILLKLQKRVYQHGDVDLVRIT